jgi:hypothetical protein
MRFVEKNPTGQPWDEPGDDSGIVCAAAVSDGAMRSRLLVACYAPLPSRILDRLARMYADMAINHLFIIPAEIRNQ